MSRDVPASTDENATSVAPTAPGKTYGHHAARGFAAAMTSTILSRIISIIGLTVMGWYIPFSDWGIAGVVMSVSTLGAVTREFGLAQMLNRHPQRFEQWAPDALWFSVILGMVSAIAIGISAPLAAWIMQKPIVLPTLIMAIGWMLHPPATVAGAALGLDLRFKLIARLATLLQLGTTLLGIAMAILGSGVYAIIVPVAAMNIARFVLNLYVCPPRSWKWSANGTRLRVMLINGWPLALATIFVTVVLQGDNLILGIFQDEAVVGAYYFAWQIGAQLVGVLGLNLASVLLPIFGHIRNDYARQRSAFLKACSLICLIGMPPFFLQAALAGPVFEAIWRGRKSDAVVPLMLLSIGMSFRLLNTIVTPLLWSQGRLREYLILCAVGAVGFLIAVTSTAPLSAHWAVPMAVALFFIVNDLASVVLALTDRARGFRVRNGIRDLGIILAYPLLISVLVFATCWPLAIALEKSLGSIASVLIAGSFGVAMQFGSTYCLQRPLLAELSQRVTANRPGLARIAKRFGLAPA